MRKDIIETRQRFEMKSISDTELARVYQTYNSVPDIRLFIARAKKLFPKLNCGLASAYLRSKLNKGSVVQGKYGNHPHTFLKIENIIIDITSDQYGGPKVYVGPLRKPWALRSYNNLVY